MSTYLKKSIAAIIAAMALGHGINAYANNSSTGPDTMDTIFVFGWDNPYDVANDAFNWTIDDYNAWDVGISNESGSGGTGSYDPPPIASECDKIKQRKPMNCPNPIPYPSGYGYGRDFYPSGSGIPRLLYWIEHVPAVDPGARDVARSGLALHTFDLTQQFVTRDRANERLLLAVQDACRRQNLADDHTFTAVSAMEANCLEVLTRLQAEAGDPGFRGYFFDWLQREGIHLDDLGIPETLLDWMAPSNSLRLRQEHASADAVCSQWWTDAQANQCVL